MLIGLHCFAPTLHCCLQIEIVEEQLRQYEQQWVDGYRKSGCCLGRRQWQQQLSSSRRRLVRRHRRRQPRRSSSRRCRPQRRPQACWTCSSASSCEGRRQRSMRWRRRRAACRRRRCKHLSSGRGLALFPSCWQEQIRLWLLVARCTLTGSATSSLPLVFLFCIPACYATKRYRRSQLVEAGSVCGTARSGVVTARMQCIDMPGCQCMVALGGRRRGSRDQ